MTTIIPPILGRRHLLGAAAALGATALGAATPVRTARAQGQTIRIGVLTDLNGPYAANTGKGSVIGAQLAAEDFMKAHPGVKVEVIEADFQLKPDVAVGLAREWFDTKDVDMILDVPLSSAAFALATLVKDKDKVAMFTGTASSLLTGANCGPNHVHWIYDTWSAAASTGRAMVASGGDSWFFIAADYAFGKSLADDTGKFVEAAGGKVLGRVAHPFPGTTDFSSYLVQAQASGAKVIGLANGGTDTVNCVKQAAEFGITKKQRLVGMTCQITDVHPMGLQSAQGLYVSEAFYWDMNDGTRGFSDRYAAKMGGIRPCSLQAGNYSAVMHYLKSAAAIGVDKAKASGRAVMAHMKTTPTDDIIFGKGTLRQDGRATHPMYLFQVKSPAESKKPWDYYKLVRTIPADQAFRPLNEGACPLVKA